MSKSVKDTNETKAKATVIETSERLLKHALTDAERLVVGQELADGYQTLAEAEAELAAIKADYKGRIDGANALVGRKSSLLRSGYEMRQTPVEVMKDYAAGTVTVTRLDTMTIVDVRNMTGDERQMGLDIAGAGNE